MPPVREISVDNCIYIKLSDGSVFYQSGEEIQTLLSSFPGNLKKKEKDYNDWLMSQSTFISIYDINDYGEDHDVLGDPDNLPAWRWVQGQNVYEVIMWVAVHFYDDNPLRLTIRCQNKEVGPIESGWWAEGN